MTKNKTHCKHSKEPDYSPEEQEAANELVKRIDAGDIDAYIALTHLAVSVCNEGRFIRATCEQCEERT